MFCPHCGTRLPDESRFCSECGAAVTAAPGASDWETVTQPLPGTPPVSGPDFVDPVRPSLFRRLLGWIVKISLLIAVLTLAGVFVSQLGTKPLEEHYPKGDWTYSAITWFDGTYTIRKGNTEYERDIKRIWESIRSETVREAEDNIVNKINNSENISLFMMEEEGDYNLYLAVTPEGEMYVNDGTGTTRYFEDARDIYNALKVFLLMGDEVSLANCLPSGNCTSLSISFYDKDMNLYDSVYMFEPEKIQESLQRLRQLTVKYGGGVDMDYDGYMAMVGITEEDGNYYFVQIYEDGSADIPQGNWVYGFYGAVDFYNALWDELCILKGY